MIAILNAVAQRRKPVKLGARTACDRRDIVAFRVRDDSRRDGGVLANGRLDFRMIFQKFSALQQRLLVRHDFANIAQFNARFRKEVMLDFQL